MGGRVVSPAVAFFVAVTLAVSAVCIAVRVAAWWRARAACNRAAWYAAQAAAERNPGRRAAWRLLARLDAEVEQPARRRLAVAVFPRPALVFADTPRPDCEACHGVGGWDAGDMDAVCPCWDPAREVRLVPLPLWLGRRMWHDAGRAER
jgi:hypothetical protein